MNSVLLLDIGNTGIKWQYRMLREQHSGRVERNATAIQSLVKGLGQLNTVLLSSVSDDDFNQQVADWIQSECSATLLWAASEASAGGLINSYEHPATMGVDRWLALRGAWSIAQTSCCVVDAGTAVTIDLVSELGRHLGGFILPGAHLSQSTLRRDTARIRFDMLQTATIEAGSSTAACVTAGSWLQIVGAVQRVMASYQPERVLLTGGDAPVLIDLGILGEHHPDLLFCGLWEWGQDRLDLSAC